MTEVQPGYLVRLTGKVSTQNSRDYTMLLVMNISLVVLIAATALPIIIFMTEPYMFKNANKPNKPSFCSSEQLWTMWFIGYAGIIFLKFVLGFCLSLLIVLCASWLEVGSDYLRTGLKKAAIENKKARVFFYLFFWFFVIYVIIYSISSVALQLYINICNYTVYSGVLMKTAYCLFSFLVLHPIVIGTLVIVINKLVQKAQTEQQSIDLEPLVTTE